MAVDDASRTTAKRRKPHDFFTNSARHCKQVGQVNPVKGIKRCTDKQKISTNPDDVPGLIIIPDFITEQQEEETLGFLDAQEWRTDLSRRTMHFGGNYCLYTRPVAGQKPGKPDIIEAPPMPRELDWLVQMFVDHGIYAAINDKRPEYVIVNEYKSKMGISAHTENFSFHSPVLGLSLGSTDVMRFHELSEAFDGSVRTGKAAKAPRTGRVVDVTLPGRSLCIMTDAARWNWQHEIRAVKRPSGFRRVSLTFRVKKVG